jgi:hypothetical protein
MIVLFKNYTGEKCMKKYLLMLICLTIIAGCDIQGKDKDKTSTPTVLFSDNFNRTDSSTVGNDWTEIAISGTATSIVSNELVLTGTWTTEPVAAAVGRSLSIPGSFRVTINFTMEDNSSLTPQVMNGSNGYILYMTSLSSGMFYISTAAGDAALMLATVVTPYTFNVLHNYTVVWTKSGSTLSVTMTDNTAHTTVTKSGTSSTYSSFNLFDIVGGGATSGADKSTYVDDVTVESL